MENRYKTVLVIVAIGISTDDFNPVTLGSRGMKTQGID
jgi:hypothetical protein